MLNEISHIGIAVKSIAETQKFYEKLGLKVSEIEEVPSQKVKVAFLQIGESRLELVEPTSEDSTIAKFIEKKGEGVQHIAFEVEDIKKELQHAVEQGIDLIDKEPRQGAHGATIAFLHPKSSNGVLVELCQEKH
jgi:methylmalonyl-CoA epimerase